MGFTLFRYFVRTVWHDKLALSIHSRHYEAQALGLASRAHHIYALF